MFSSQCNFSPIKAFEFSCNYTRVQPATADVSAVVANTLLRDGSFSFCVWGVGTYRIKVLHKKFKRKQNHAQEKYLKKQLKHAFSLNLYMNRYLKIQEKIDLESQEQTFIIIPQGIAQINLQWRHFQDHLNQFTLKTITEFIVLIIYTKKLLNSDWLRKECSSSVTRVQNV